MGTSVCAAVARRRSPSERTVSNHQPQVQDRRFDVGRVVLYATVAIKFTIVNNFANDHGWRVDVSGGQHEADAACLGRVGERRADGVRLRLRAALAEAGASGGGEARILKQVCDVLHERWQSRVSKLVLSMQPWRSNSSKSLPSEPEPPGGAVAADGEVVGVARVTTVAAS